MTYHMKKLILNTVLLTMLILNLKSQTETPVTPVKNKSFEIGMNMYTLGFSNMFYSDIFNRPAPWGYYYPEQHVFNHYLANGIYFKYFKGQNSFRASLNYFQKLSIYDKGGMVYQWDNFYPSYSSSTTRAGEVKIGYQRMFGKRKLAPYFFADLRYRYSRTEGFNYSGYYACATCFAPQRFADKYLIEQSYFGINKGLGLRLTLSRITFNLETSFEFYFVRSQDIKNSREKINNTGFTINPLQFSTGFTF
jgi:hypothetical protein